MVRSSTYRTSKYAAKLVGDVWKNRIDAQRDSMIEQVTNRFDDLEGVETAAKGLLTTWGISVTLIPSFLAFARECYRITDRHEGSIAVNEMCVAAHKWNERDLDLYRLQQIAFAVTAVDISSCT